MHKMLRWLAAAAFFVICDGCPLLAAQQQDSANAEGRDIAPLDPDLAAQLDALLATNNWNGLGAALTPKNDPATFLKSLRWLSQRMHAGRGGMFVAMIFARDLSELGEASAATLPASDVDDINRDPRITAAMISFYTLALIVVDGPECEDKTAPSHRLDQILAARMRNLGYLKSRPPYVVEKAIDGAVALERQTSLLRGPDDELCRDGLEQMMAAAKLSPGKEIPSPPGTVGRTIALPDVPGWQPKFNTPEIYKPMQDTARANLKSYLARLVGQH